MPAGRKIVTLEDFRLAVRDAFRKGVEHADAGFAFDGELETIAKQYADKVEADCAETSIFELDELIDIPLVGKPR